MLDEIERLRTNPFLLQLLGHYVRLAEPDREVWQDRLMSLDGVEASDLSKLHGDLLAFGWIEWGSGKKSSACYRVTSDGLRAYRLIDGGVAHENLSVFGAEIPTLKAPMRKREKKPAQELVTTDA